MPHYTLELKGIMGYNCEKKTAVPTEKTGRRFSAGIKYVEKITDCHLGFFKMAAFYSWIRFTLTSLHQLR